MKRIFNLRQHLNFRSALTYALVFVFSFICAPVHTIHNAMGQVATEEPYISLNVKNKPLGDVLKKISEDTGYKFKLNHQWSSYPVNASFGNMPLHQVLKRILVRLNHTIVYEPDKSIKIVIYGEADTRKVNQNPTQSTPSQIQRYPQGPALTPGPPPENADAPERVDESSKDTDASGVTEEKSIEKIDSVENAEKESTEKTGAAESKEPDKDSSGPSENPKEQDGRKKADEGASPDSTQKQN